MSADTIVGLLGGLPELPKVKLRCALRKVAAAACVLQMAGPAQSGLVYLCGRDTTK